MKKFNCPLGVPVGIGLLKVGFMGIVINSIDFNLFNLGISVTLFLMGGPIIRIFKQVTKLTDKLIELEQRVEGK